MAKVGSTGLTDRQQAALYYARRRRRHPLIPQSIRLVGHTVSEDAPIGTLVGTFGVTKGMGTYNFTLLNNAGGLFALDGIDSGRLEVAGVLDYETAHHHVIEVRADNGVDDPITQQLVIKVTKSS